MWSERIAHEALKHGKVIQVILNVYKTHVILKNNFETNTVLK